MSYLQAIVIALVQGVTELFPVSSLGHSVLVPAWIGGSWETLVTQSSQADSESSFYLAYIVALHCATALALLCVLPRRLGAHHPRVLPERRPQHPRADVHRPQRRRAPGLADRPRHDPRRHHGPRARTRLPDRLRQAARRQHLPVHQRPDPAARRAGAPQRRGAAAGDGDRRRAGRATSPAEASRSRSARPPARRCAPDRRLASADDVEAAVASDRRIAGISYRDGLSVGLAAGPRAAPRDQPLGHHDGRRPVARALPRGRRPLRVPARDARHLRRRRAQAPEPRRLGRGQHPRPGRRRRRSSPASPRTSPCATSSGTSRRARSRRSRSTA